MDKYTSPLNPDPIGHSFHIHQHMPGIWSAGLVAGEIVIREIYGEYLDGPLDVFARLIKALRDIEAACSEE